MACTCPFHCQRCGRPGQTVEIVSNGVVVFRGMLCQGCTAEAERIAGAPGKPAGGAR